MICFEVPAIPIEIGWMLMGAVCFLVLEIAFFGMIIFMPEKQFREMDKPRKVRRD
jgi:hypothetical protein